MPYGLLEMEAEDQLLLIMLLGWFSFVIIMRSEIFLILTCPSKDRPKETKKAVCFSKVEDHISAVLKLCAKEPQCTTGNPQEHCRMFLVIQEHTLILNTVKYCPNYQLNGVQSFNIRLRHIWYWQNWVFISCYVKKKLSCKNQCETGNEGEGVQLIPRFE